MKYFEYGINELILVNQLVEKHGIDKVARWLRVKPITISTWKHRKKVPYKRVGPIHRVYRKKMISK